MSQPSDILSGPAPSPSRGVNWDPVVRVTHWVVALSVLLNGLIIEEESQLHNWIGYAVLAMLALRVLWGIVGPEEARFSSFPPIHEMEDIHEVAANLVLLLAAAHVCGVVFESRLSGVNLIRNMTIRTKSRGRE